MRCSNGTIIGTSQNDYHVGQRQVSKELFRNIILTKTVFKSQIKLVFSCDCGGAIIRIHLVCGSATIVDSFFVLLVVAADMKRFIARYGTTLPHNIHVNVFAQFGHVVLSTGWGVTTRNNPSDSLGTFGSEIMK